MKRFSAPACLVALALLALAFASPAAAWPSYTGGDGQWLRPGGITIVNDDGTICNFDGGTGGGGADCSGAPAIVAALLAAAVPVPLPVTGVTRTNRSTTITTGGAAQTIAGGAPNNGYEVCNPNASEEAWVSDLTTAAANGAGSFRVPPNGGCYDLPFGAKPAGAISVIAVTTGHALTISTW